MVGRVSTMMEGGGTLGQTSLVQLLVQALDRRWTGALELGSDGTVVELRGGVPARVLVPDGYALLGELFVERGLATEAEVAAALDRKATEGRPLGAELIAAGVLDEATVKRGLGLQVMRRAVRLFALPAATTWRFHAGDPRFAELPVGERIDSLRVLAAAILQHDLDASRVDLVLALLDDAPLVLKDDVRLERFGLQGDALAVATHILAEQPTFDALVSSGVGSVEVCRRVVYLLASSRFLRQGDDARAAARQTPPPPTPKPSTPGSPSREDLASGPPRKVTRIQLKRVAKARSSDDAQEGLDRESEPPPSVSAPLPIEEEPPPESRLSPAELQERIQYVLSREKPEEALRLCELARARSTDDPWVAATSVWIRAQLPRPDLKVLMLELDDLLLVDPDLIVARYYRGLVRRRLGQDSAAKQDFERVAAREPSHHGARAQLAELAAKASAPAR